jgi:hypothetical protein
VDARDHASDRATREFDGRDIKRQDRAAALDFFALRVCQAAVGARRHGKQAPRPSAQFDGIACEVCDLVAIEGDDRTSGRAEPFGESVALAARRDQVEADEATSVAMHINTLV